MAMDAFLEVLEPSTSKARKAEIEQQLLAYCARHLCHGSPVVDILQLRTEGLIWQKRSDTLETVLLAVNLLLNSAWSQGDCQ